MQILDVLFQIFIWNSIFIGLTILKLLNNLIQFFIFSDLKVNCHMLMRIEILLLTFINDNNLIGSPFTVDLLLHFLKLVSHF